MGRSRKKQKNADTDGRNLTLGLIPRDVATAAGEIRSAMLYSGECPDVCAPFDL